MQARLRLPRDGQGATARERRSARTGDAGGTGKAWQTARPADAVARVDGPCALSGPDAHDPDAELVERVAQRDPAAVRTIVSRKLPRLVALATRMLGDRMEAEDVAQEVFMRIWKHAPSWRPGEARFDTWLHRVALNLCYDRLRRHREEPVDDMPEQADPQAAPDVQLEAQANAARVRAALATLPARQREALVLNYYQELSNLEAATSMGITVDALESLLARARRNLRAQLDGRSKDTP